MVEAGSLSCKTTTRHAEPLGEVCRESLDVARDELRRAARGKPRQSVSSQVTPLDYARGDDTVWVLTTPFVMPSVVEA